MKIIYCLDFDGTLTPIRRNPDAVYPSRALLRFLSAMVRRPDRRVAVISGRALKDLKKRISVPGVILIGSHGREAQIAALRVSGAPVRNKAAIVKLLQNEFLEMPGIVFESKPHSLVVHYRRAEPAVQKRIERQFLLKEPELKKRGAHILRAKKAFEISFYPSDKGAVIRKIKKLFPGWKKVIAGDDETDRDMFRAASRSDLTVGTGDVRGAQLKVRGSAELLALLRKLDRQFT